MLSLEVMVSVEVNVKILVIVLTFELEANEDVSGEDVELEVKMGPTRLEDGEVTGAEVVSVSVRGRLEVLGLS